MLEIALCSLITIFPEYLYRRYIEGKRIGHELTIYSIWFELRWGITTCLLLTVILITIIVYNYPSTTNVTSAEDGSKVLFASFRQSDARVIKVGMAAEATCVSKPLTIIPMVVTGVQDYIGAGEIRAGEQLIEAHQEAKLISLEPLYEGGLDGVTAGSSCIANAYSSNHDRLETADLGMITRIYLHTVDAVGVVHAISLRAQALMLPVQTLVFAGH
jgi:hypothetical protein